MTLNLDTTHRHHSPHTHHNTHTTHKHTPHTQHTHDTHDTHDTQHTHTTHTTHTHTHTHTSHTTHTTQHNTQHTHDTHDTHTTHTTHTRHTPHTTHHTTTLLEVHRFLPELDDVGHFVVQFHTVQVSCCDLVVGFLCDRSFFCCPCIFAFQRYPSFTVFCHFDPCVVILHIVSCCRFSLFRLEEFVNLVFPSSFWSSHGSVGFLFCVDFRVPSHLSSGGDAILIANLHCILL